MNMMKKRFLVLVLIITMLICGIPCGAWAAPSGFETGMRSAILIDGQTGRVLFSKNVHESLPPASITKIMTMLLAVEAIEQGKVKLTDQVVASEEAYKIGGSEIWLEPNEMMSLEDILAAIAVHSANDACVAAAEHIYGTEEAFLAAMNKKAKALGLKDTYFLNTNGLPEESGKHVMSAYDIAVLSVEAMKHPLFKKFSTQKEVFLRDGENHFYNRNQLIATYPGANGIKTGWTVEAGYCLSASAVKNNLHLISVVMGGSEPKSHFKESRRLLNYGFANYMAQPVINQGEKVESARVFKGKDELVDVQAKDNLFVVVEKGEEVKTNKKVQLNEEIVAPIKKGDKLGQLKVYQAGKLVGEVDLIAAYDVEKGNPWHVFKRIVKKWFQVKA